MQANSKKKKKKKNPVTCLGNIYQEAKARYNLLHNSTHKRWECLSLSTVLTSTAIQRMRPWCSDRKWGTRLGNQLATLYEVGKCESLSHVWLSATPWTVAHQDPLSMGFSRPEHWSGLSCPSLGGKGGVFPTQGSNPGLLHCKQLLYYLSHVFEEPSTFQPFWMLWQMWMRFFFLQRSVIAKQ